MAQLNDKSRKILYSNLNKRINSAFEEIDKITIDVTDPDKKRRSQDQLTDKEKEAINYLNFRIKQLQVSLRLAFNTQWLIEQREADIKTLSDKMKFDFGPSISAKDTLKEHDERNTILKLNALTKAKACSRKGCFNGRGYTGINMSTGEFTLCKCTMDTINLYKLHD